MQLVIHIAEPSPSEAKFFVQKFKSYKLSGTHQILFYSNPVLPIQYHSDVTPTRNIPTDSAGICKQSQSSTRCEGV
jgi:hypothetical protein